MNCQQTSSLLKSIVLPLTFTTTKALSLWELRHIYRYTAGLHWTLLDLMRQTTCPGIGHARIPGWGRTIFLFNLVNTSTLLTGSHSAQFPCPLNRQEAPTLTRSPSCMHQTTNQPTILGHILPLSGRVVTCVVREFTDDPIEIRIADFLIPPSCWS